MDDPLSAVDSIVAKHIFNNVFDNTNGILKNSIRVLVTHQTQFLNKVDYVIVMQNGEIMHNDRLANLNKQGINIKTLIDEKDQNINTRADISDDNDTKDNINIDDTDNLDKKNNDNNGGDDYESEFFLNDKKCQNESIIKKEEIGNGNVTYETYASLFHVDEEYFGRKCAIIAQIVILACIILLMFSAQVSLTFSDYWLGYWASQDIDKQQNDTYPTVFVSIAIVALLLAYFRAVTFFKAILRGARNLHDGMFVGVLYSPMIFFESNPIGRIMNRFSKDQWIVDELVTLHSSIYLLFIFRVTNFCLPVCIIKYYYSCHQLFMIQYSSCQHVVWQYLRLDLQVHMYYC